MVAAVSLIASACGGGHRQATPESTTTTTTAGISQATDSNAVLTVALGAQPTNWNVLAAGGAGSVLEEVVDQLWPAVYTVGPTGQATLDTNLVTAAKVVSQNPQTVQYTINGKAMWSDGTPVSYRDFVYTWEAQSGQSRYTDVGGKAFTPATTTGYSNVSSVTGSASAPDVVTVTFTHPDPDWTALFSHLAPEHVAAKAGFDTGFTDPVNQLVSAGPYVVASYQPGQDLRLVRNPTYWGPQAGLAGITFDFVPDAEQVATALAAGQLGCAELPPTPASLFVLKAASQVHVDEAGSGSYLDLDVGERHGPFTTAALRRDVLMAVDRAGLVTPAGSPPLGNRIYLPGTPQWTNNGAAFAEHGNATQARSALEGLALNLKVAVTAGDAAATTAADSIVADLRRAGVTATVLPAPDAAAALASGSADLAVEIRQLQPTLAQLAARYGTGGKDNVDGYSSNTMDNLLANAQTAPAARQAALRNQIDAQAWTDAVDLPLTQIPTVVACRADVVNVAVNPSPGGPAYNAQTWGVKGSSS